MTALYDVSTPVNPRQMTTPCKILFFDTETTGLFPDASDTTNPALPYITQLCFVLYDTETKQNIKIFNEYVQLPPEVEISEFITQLTGITREKCDNGVPIVKALRQFYRAYQACDVVVAHNIRFDRRMIELEVQRHALQFFPDMMDACFMFNSVYEMVHKKRTMCTAELGRSTCSITIPSKQAGKPPYKKMPKLAELYEHLFQEKFEGAHDALADTLACMRCFLKMCELKSIM